MAITKTINFQLEVLPAGDLFCEVSPISLTVRKPNPAVFQVTIRSLNEYAGSVDLAVAGAAASVESPVALASGETKIVPVTIETEGLADGVANLALTITGN